jgi:hypothetical protein
MNDNEAKPTVYPEQETPARPTYDATIRGNAIGGWLYYANNDLTIIVTINGQRATAEEFHFTDEDSRKQARMKAKNLWRSAVVAVLGGV